MKKNIVKITEKLNKLDELGIKALKELNIEWSEPITSKTTLYGTLMEGVLSRNVLSKMPNLQELFLELIWSADRIDDLDKTINKQKEKLRIDVLTQALIDWNKRVWVEGNPHISFKFHIKKLTKENKLTQSCIKNIGSIESLRKDVAKKLNISKKTSDDWIRNNKKAQSIIESLRPAQLTIPLGYKKKNPLEIITINLTKK